MENRRSSIFFRQLLNRILRWLAQWSEKMSVKINGHLQRLDAVGDEGISGAPAHWMALFDGEMPQWQGCGEQSISPLPAGATGKKYSLFLSEKRWGRDPSVPAPLPGITAQIRNSWNATGHLEEKEASIAALEFEAFSEETVMDESEPVSLNPSSQMAERMVVPKKRAPVRGRKPPAPVFREKAASVSLQAQTTRDAVVAKRNKEAVAGVMENEMQAAEDDPVELLNAEHVCMHTTSRSDVHETNRRDSIVLNTQRFSGTSKKPAMQFSPTDKRSAGKHGEAPVECSAPERMPMSEPEECAERGAEVQARGVESYFSAMQEQTSRPEPVCAVGVSRWPAFDVACQPAVVTWDRDEERFWRAEMEGVKWNA